MDLDFTGTFSKSAQILYLKKIRSVGAQLYHASGQTYTYRRMEGQTDRYDEVPSLFL
jgi:hypothetical protein